MGGSDISRFSRAKRTHGNEVKKTPGCVFLKPRSPPPGNENKAFGAGCAGRQACGRISEEEAAGSSGRVRSLPCMNDNGEGSSLSEPSRDVQAEGRWLRCHLILRETCFSNKCQSWNYTWAPGGAEGSTWLRPGGGRFPPFSPRLAGLGKEGHPDLRGKDALLPGNSRTPGATRVDDAGT